MQRALTRKSHFFIAAIVTVFVIVTVILWRVSAIAQCAPYDLNCMNLP